MRSTLILLCSLMIGASPAFADSAADAAIHTPLTMAKMKAFYAASVKLQMAVVKHPELKERAQVNADDTFDQSVARFQEPRLKTALADAGLSPEEYVTILDASMGAMFGALYEKMNHGKLDKVYDRDNVEFWKAHEKEIKAIQRRYMQQPQS